MFKILCTGNLGYICSHLTDYLVDKGHEVYGLDNEYSGVKANKTPGVETAKIDIRKFDDVLNYFSRIQPDVVFHLAAISRTPDAVENPLRTYETNVVGSANVLEAARQTGVKKVVLASSNIVYAAQTPYKTSKLAMEQVARDYNDLYDLQTVCLRFSNVAGGHIERQHDDNVLKSLARSKKEKGRITITGDGTQTRNFTNVMDVCDALYRAADLNPLIKFPKKDMWGLDATVRGPVRGTEIDIMNPKTWELNEIAKMFDCPIDYVDERKGDVKHLKMGIGPRRAEDLLGFTAKIDLMDYIKSYTEL